MTYLLSRITDIAKATFKEPEGEFEMADYDRFVEHWFAVAETAKDEFKAEGLTETVLEMERIIYEQKRISNAYRKT